MTDQEGLRCHSPFTQPQSMPPSVPIPIIPLGSSPSPFLPRGKESALCVFISVFKVLPGDMVASLCHTAQSPVKYAQPAAGL